MQIICAECYVRQGEKNQAGINVLLCNDPTHKKISKDSLIELTAQLFPGFLQSIQESMALSCSDLDAVKTNSQDLQLESYFNSETGEKELGIIPESIELPKKVGGAPVRLLIGIKDVPMFPKLLHREEVQNTPPPSLSSCAPEFFPFGLKNLVVFTLLMVTPIGSFMDTDQFLSLDMVSKPDPPIHYVDVRYDHVIIGFFLPRNLSQDVMGEQLFYGQITRSYFMFYSLAMIHYFSFDLSCKQEKIMQILCANHDGLAHTFARASYFLYDCRNPEELYAHAMVAAHTGQTRLAHCFISFHPGQAYYLRNSWLCIFISIRLYFPPKFYLWTFFLPSRGVRGRGLFRLLPPF